jgi:hypothetical protein
MTTEALHGTTWTELYRKRDTLAAYWYTRQGTRIPLEEYQSMGNEALAEGLATFDPTKSLSLLPYVTILLHNRLRQVRLRQAGAGNLQRTNGATRGLQKYQTDTQDAAWWPVHAGITRPVGEARVYLTQILAYLKATLADDTWQMFEQHVHGDTLREIGDAHGVSLRRVDYLLRHARQALYAWQGQKERRCLENY